MAQDIRIPDIGENVESGEVVKVLVSAGDTVEKDQAIIELETEKAVVEIPSPYSGKIIEISVEEGDQVKIGQMIARVEAQVEGTRELERAETPKQEKEELGLRRAEQKREEEGKRDELEQEPEQKGEEEVEAEVKPKTERGEKKQVQQEKKLEAERTIAAAGPSVRRLARELGANIDEIEGTGPGERITPEDVKRHVSRAAGGRRSRSLPDFSQWGETRREKMSKVRRLTAEAVGYSWSVVPHVTQFDQADISEVEEFRKRYGPVVEKEGGKLTVTVILMKIMAEALRAFPRFNSSLDPVSNEIIFKQYYHIGIAVDTERGLLVPVIRDVDKKRIKELAVELTDVAERARNKKIQPDEMEGGTFTISNQGGIGGVDFTPVVYWPQVAILGVSRATTRPIYRDNRFVPRLILPLSLSYDHRVNDGADAARFLRWVSEALEHPFLLQLGS